jgi:pSer/pThr/pTyr-binding forkhead associated (FHA) protein
MAKKDFFNDETHIAESGDDFVIQKNATIDARGVPRLEAHGKSRELSNKAFGLGRDKRNAVIIADPSVSKLHAVISFKKGKGYIRDSNSKNGTIINEKKIPSNVDVELHNKDTIILGGTKITFLC